MNWSAESLGGDTLFVEVSAKNKTNLDKLKKPFFCNLKS